MASYRELIVWQRAIALAESVYTVTRSFPAEERFGLTNQLRRAAVSIASNIAEGHGRGAKADFARFLRVARGSLREVETQLIIAERVGLLNAADLSKLLDQAEDVARVLHGLINSNVTTNC